jgi:hypothetical protein
MTELKGYKDKESYVMVGVVKPDCTQSIQFITYWYLSNQSPCCHCEEDPEVCKSDKGQKCPTCSG